MVTEVDRWLRDENGQSLIPTGSLQQTTAITANSSGTAVQSQAVIQMQFVTEIEVRLFDPKRKRIEDGSSNIVIDDAIQVNSDKQASPNERVHSAQ